MKMIPDAPSAAGNYDFHESTVTELPEGMLLWPEGLSTGRFFEQNGFIAPEVEELDGVPTVVGYGFNEEAWEAFLASALDEPEADGPEPGAQAAGDEE